MPAVFLDEPDPDEPIYGPGGEREGGFETDHTAWESYSRVRGELRDLLDPFEWRAASRAVLSAHYTPQAVAEAMWQGLAAYGFEGGEVLEAGFGSGVFCGVAPLAARLTGVELDPITAAIAGWIYPHANVLAESFAETDVPLGTFDAVIGNVPFAQAPFGDRRLGGDYNLHNGFIIKQLALLRPGAYMTVITSRWTLDGERSTPARRAMARWGDLAAAYRMPRGTFGETGDTNVVADVLVFRRRAEGEEPGDQVWVEASERELGGHTLAVNAYFTEHPENVLGRMTSEQGPYGPRVTVQGDPDAAPRLLRERMEATAAAAVADGLGYTHHGDWPHREPLLLQAARVKHATDFTGRLYTDDHGLIWQHVNGADPVRVITADGVSGTEQLRTLLALRDVAGELQELDRTGHAPDRAREIRDQLARLHASYTEKHGPLSRPRQTRLALPNEEAAAAARDAGVDLDGEDRLPTGWGWFRQDPHAAVVLGLEHWDRANDRAVPSEVLTRRPGARRGDLEPTDDPKTALTTVMGATGRVDLPLIASLLGTTAEEARLRLGTEIFDNPVTKKLEHAGAYLSGAVRQKLEQAREAAATDPKYAVNVAALEVVQPPPKRLGQFTAQLGAHWIPAPLVQGFLREYLGDPTLQVSHNERYGWSLAAGKIPDAINALKGTDRRSALHIAKALLGRASMVVNLLDGSGVDEDATRAMRYKADAMRSAFEDYCTASTLRVTQLTDAYNRQMNGHVVRNYDSLAPTLEGFTTERTPHPWQLSGAARMQFERSVILAHEVGLGKTTTMVMGSQALKASGQIAKPYAVVQSHLARQWLDEAKLLYPNADIRLITSDDLADGNRRPMLEWLRANTPDLVIFTEGAFRSIRMSPEQQELYLFRELESLKEQLERERGIPHNAFALMKLEQRLATVEARIRRNDAPMRTPGEVYWNDLGFDYGLIDEGHRFTAIEVRSKEAGGETASLRAVDLHQKLNWRHQVAEADGGRPTVTIGTGTPMENSIFEQYKLLEMACPWLLDQFGVHGPDLWSETFGQKVQRIEMAPDGSGLTIVERYSRFISKPTMKTMWGLATDTKTGDEVGIERPRLAGGAPQLVLVEPTADQQARLRSLVTRGQAIHAGDVTREEDNMLAVSGEGRAVALDPRLVDANAPAGNKLVKAADIIAAGYHAHKDHTYAVSSRDDTPHPVPGGLFFVFCNSGTPGGNNKGGFDAYAELRDLLADRGVPRDLVQFAQDNATPEKKAAMSQAANNGGIAVLMGSTEVLGTGFNGQNRAYALMHLDQDWTPASMIQRNGRVHRPGNQHEEVSIYFLATKGSMDAWQVGLLTSKAEGLRDIQRPPGEGDDDGDTVEEIGESDWDYATMAAEIGGNPYMRQFMEAKIHLQGLEADRRNAAADRVRQMELLGVKEGELVGTRAAIAAREKALPKITETIRGDAFRIRIGGREFDRFGEAAPVLRQVVTEAVRAHQNEGIGAWKKLGTFGGLDFAVRPEILPGSGEVRAYIGFPELRHSESRCSVEDLVKGNFGATMLGRLATALEKAEDHQLMDRERVPGLEKEIAVLTAQQEAVNYGPAIEHARRRLELLDGIVGAITERDKIPELSESMLDPKKYPTENSRKKALLENAEKRAPHQANVDAAAARLAAFDAENPAPEPVVLVNTWTEDNDTDEAFEQWRERQRIIVQQNREAGLGAPVVANESAPAPEDGAANAAAAEPSSAPGEHTAGQAPEPEPGGDSTEEPAAETAEPPGDGYGTADLFNEFGLTEPERVPAPVPQGEPDPEAETEESAGVPDGQMTVEEVQSEAVAGGQDTAGAGAAARDDGRERLTSADGRLTFALLVVPADAGFHQEAVDGYQRRRGELAAVVEAKNEQPVQTPAEQADQLDRWRQTYKTANGLEPLRPPPSLDLSRQEDGPGLIPAEYGIGSWVTWRDGPNGQQVTGQVMSPGPGKDTWYVSTDRTGVTGEYHVLSRSGKKATGYSYALNGAAVDLRPADGPVEQVPFEDLSPVDSVSAGPLTSYADYVPRKGLAVVREPIPVTVGEITPTGPELVFDVLADGVPFVVGVTRHASSGVQIFTPRIEIDGETVRTFGSAESWGGAVEICERVVREAREDAAKPLRAHGRNYDFAPAADGLCGRYNLHADDAGPQPLYRVGDSEPLCIEHVVSTFDVEMSEVSKLARAHQIWGTRVVAEPAAAAPGTPPADVEQPEEAVAQETAAVAASQDPHEVARETLQGGNRITVVVSGRSIEWDGEAWGLPVPVTVTVTGTVYPGYRDYRQNTTLLDAVIVDQTGREVTATDTVFIRQLPPQAQLIPAEHRDDLRPETRTVAQVRLGDLIAEGGTRGESVTELRFADNNRRGSVMGFSTRDVATGTANGFVLNFTEEVQIVPRERRAPQDVAAVFGRHGSHDQVVLETQRTYDLHAAVAEVTSRVWPDGAGPQDEIQALSRAIGAIDATARGVDPYRANAAAMEAAGTAAAALFAATDDDMLNRYVGLPLHRLRQHLDVQAQRLHADVAHLTERAAAASAENTSNADESTPPAPEEQRVPDQPTDRTQEGEGVASRSTGETEQLGLFGDPSEDPAEPETTTGSGAVPADELLAQSVMTEDGRGAQLQAALIEGETIAPVSFTDRREPAAGWILTTAGGHTFRLRPVTYARPDEDQWEAGHDADGSHWWAANVEDRPLPTVLARIREDSATRTRFASLWARYGHLTAQAPQFETTTDRVQLEEGVYLVSRFGRIGLIASCRWGWEHLTDPDGAQGHTGEDWSRKGPDNRQYVAEWKIWNSAQDAIPNPRLRVVAQLTDDMADTPDAYCDASQPYVGKCSAKRSGARYTVAVDTDQGSELGHYTVCARCLSHRLLKNDEDRQIGHRDVQSLVQALAKGDPKVGDLHWKQWPDRTAELAGQMLSTALDAGETAPWPAQALTAQILTEACEAGDDRAMREARAKVKAAGGDATAQKRAADEAFAARQDRAALVARHGATHMDAANETDRAAVAILGLAGWGMEGSDAAPEPAEEAPVVVDVNTLTVSPQVRNGEPSSYEFTVTGPGLTVGEYGISHDAQGKGARGIMWRATWHGVEPSGRWDVISIGSGEGESAALAAVAEHAAKAGGDLAAGFAVARRMHYDAGLWLLPDVGESEAIQYHPDGSWTITAETGAPYTVRREWRGRTASGDLAPLLIEDQAGTLIASCTAVDSYMSAWAPMLERLRLHATAVADGVQHATAVTLGGPTQEWVEAWCVCSWTERADVAKYADRVPTGEALAQAHRQETSAAAEAPAAAELPELDVVLLDVDVPPLDPAEPYDTDEEAQAESLPGTDHDDRPKPSAPPSRESHTVHRGTLWPGSLIAFTLDDIDAPKLADRELSGPLVITGHVYTGYRPALGTNSRAILLDAVVRDPAGGEVAAGDIAVQAMPERVLLTPAGHRKDWYPEGRGVTNVHVGDLVAEVGARGAVVTAVAYASDPRGASTFFIRDVVTGAETNFTRLHSNGLSVVPRERRLPGDVAPLFGEHTSHDTALADTQSVLESYQALQEAAALQWPDGDGPQPELRWLHTVMSRISPQDTGAEAYRSNAEAMTTARTALVRVFAQSGRVARYEGHMGRPLHELGQRLDIQAHKLSAFAARLVEQAKVSAGEDTSPVTAIDVAQTETAEAPAAAELPVLNVVLVAVDVPPPDPAEPYTTDEEAQAAIDHLDEAFARWNALPTVQRYYDADRQQRPDGSGEPTNPVAQLAAAYQDTGQFLSDDPAGTPEDMVRQVHTVAVWSGALEHVVDEDLRGPLGEVREAATLLASRSQATVEAFEEELAALAANSAEQDAIDLESAAAEPGPDEQASADVDGGPETPESSTEPDPSEPTADTGPVESAADAPVTTDTETDGVTDGDPVPEPEEAPEPPAAVDDGPAPNPQDTQEPAVAVPDEGMYEARREASFLEQDRPPTTDGDEQTSEPGTVAAPPEPDPAPAPASEDAPGDETARDASEDPTMTTPPIPETTDVPDEPIIEDPPAPQRYVQTARLRLFGLDGQPADSGEVLQGDLVVATLHPGAERGWFARLAADGLPADVTYVAGEAQDAAAYGAIMYSAFTGSRYGWPPDAAAGEDTQQRVEALRANLREVAVQHRDALVGAAARVQREYSEHFVELRGALDGLAAAVSEGYGSQQMVQHLDAVQGAVNALGGSLPSDPDHPERRQLAFPLAHLLYDSRFMQDQVQATLAAVQAEQETARAEAAAAAVALNESYLADYRAGRPPRDEAAAAAYREWQQLDAEDQQEAVEARGLEDEVTAAATDAVPQQEGTESRSPGVPESQSTGTAREEAPVAPAGTTADAPAPENPDGAAPSEGDGPAPDVAVDAIRQALEDALRAADQPGPAAPEPGELPLWTGPEASPADTAATEPPAGPMDVRAEFQAVLDAWDEHVPSENGTAQDLVAELDADLATLQRAFAEAVAPAAPAEPSTAPAPADTAAEGAAAVPVPQQADAVNSALQQADTHAAALQDFPEWQRIQTVRGAVGHLVRVMRERAGEHFERLMGDNRVGEFFRRVSINACEKIAGWAQAGADWLRRRGEGPDAPAADALRGVADAASAYSSPGGGRSGPPPASRDTASATVDIPAMRQLGDALSRPLPGAMDGRGTRVSTAAARGKSTTRGAVKKPSGAAKKKSGGAAEQAGHLRRGGAEPQQQNPKPTQR